MLLSAVLAWIVFTLAIGFVQPPASACIINNGTDDILVPAFGGVREIEACRELNYFVNQKQSKNYVLLR